jgi:hypothetical protein
VFSLASAGPYAPIAPDAKRFSDTVFPSFVCPIWALAPWWLADDEKARRKAGAVNMAMTYSVRSQNGR